jgi:hypothetical protein
MMAALRLFVPMRCGLQVWKTSCQQLKRLCVRCMI